MTLRWSPSDRISLGATGTTFQQIEQFRLGDGRAWGGGLNADLGISDRTTLAGGFTVLRQTNEGGAVSTPWNQSRGWAALRIRVGEDPGLAARRSER